MTTTIIDTLYNNNQELIKYLAEKGEISFETNMQDTFRKTLLLASASYFESIMTESLTEFFNEHVGTTDIILHFIRNKAMNRQYHSYFQWEKKNANSFFGLFGEDFKKFIEIQVKTDNKLEDSIKAFLELGDNRNRLVHGNYANYDLPKTADEIYELYKTALHFVEMFPQKLNEYLKESQERHSEEES